MEILISGQLQPFDDRALNIQVLRWTHSFWTTELAHRKEKSVWSLHNQTFIVSYIQQWQLTGH